jgi:isopentenyl-diphosphate delta-isomerase
MTEPGGTSLRKLDHVRINLEEDVSSRLTTGLELYRLVPTALPELDLNRVSTAGSFLGRTVAAPVLISSMTGGAEGLGDINRRLAEATQERRIAMGVGSQRAAIEAEAETASFKVRDVAPDAVLFANLGAIQLNYGYGIEECKRAVDMIEANALILHLNALQEALQPEGDTQWGGLLSRIEDVARHLPVPVIAKEVGFGISGDDARRLADAGVEAIDVAGAGGTSWSEVEMHRAESEAARRIAGAFARWGLPTADCILQVRQAVPGIEIIASGGIRDGIDVAKSVALGASLVGMAGPFLRAATQSTAAVVEEIDVTVNVLRAAMFAAGAGTLDELGDGRIRGPEGNEPGYLPGGES